MRIVFICQKGCQEYIGLFKEFEQYLLHGGFLTAINDMAEKGFIIRATYFTYSDWIRGDVLKRGKQEHFLRDIIAGILKRYTSQVTWNNLLADLSIDHPKTVADYIAILAHRDQMDRADTARGSETGGKISQQSYLEPHGTLRYHSKYTVRAAADRATSSK